MWARTRSWLALLQYTSAINNAVSAWCYPPSILCRAALASSRSMGIWALFLYLHSGNNTLGMVPQENRSIHRRVSDISQWDELARRWASHHHSMYEMPVTQGNISSWRHRPSGDTPGWKQDSDLNGKMSGLLSPLRTPWNRTLPYTCTRKMKLLLFTVSIFSFLVNKAFATVYIRPWRGGYGKIFWRCFWWLETYLVADTGIRSRGIRPSSCIAL